MQEGQIILWEFLPDNTEKTHNAFCAIFRQKVLKTNLPWTTQLVAARVGQLKLNFICPTLVGANCSLPHVWLNSSLDWISSPVNSKATCTVGYSRCHQKLNFWNLHQYSKQCFSRKNLGLKEIVVWILIPNFFRQPLNGIACLSYILYNALQPNPLAGSRQRRSGNTGPRVRVPTKGNRPGELWELYPWGGGLPRETFRGGLTGSGVKKNPTVLEVRSVV